MQTIAEVCATCNEARIEAKNGLFKAVGAPTEAALVVLAEKLGLADEAEQQRADETRRADPEGNLDAVTRRYLAKWVLLCFMVSSSANQDTVKLF